MRKVAAVLGSLALVVGFSACGTRLSQSEIEAAARGNVATGTGGGATSTGTGTGTEATGTGTQSTGTGTSSGSSSLGGQSTTGSSGGGSVTGGSTAGGTSSTGSSKSSTAAGPSSGGSTSGGGGGSGSSGGSTTGGGGSVGTSGSTIVVGNVGDYSGVLGALFGVAVPALQVWSKYTNAHGGLNGHPVQVVIADTGGDPSTNQTDVEQMYTQDHILAMVGNMDVLDYTGSQQYLVSNKIPLVGQDLAGPEMFSQPFFFPEGAEMNALAAVGIPAAIAQGKKVVGGVYCVETPLCQQEIVPLQGSNGAVAKAGGRLAYTAAASLTSPSFTSQCLGAKQAGVQVLELVLDAASIERVAQSCAAQNYNPLYETVSVGAIPQLDQVPQLNGLLLPTSTFPFVDSSVPADQAFQTAMRQYAPSAEIGPAASIQWASGELLVAGSKDLGANPTAAQLEAGMDTLKNYTVGGLTVPLTFNVGQNAVVPNCVFMQKIQNGGWSAYAGLKPVCVAG